MCYMWERRRGEEFPIRKFYLRRIFRIAPLFWIAIIVYFLLSRRSAIECAREIVLTATFLHGFSPRAINAIVPGGWSIAVEMIFYLLFPLVIIAVEKRWRIYLILALLTWLPWAILIRDYFLNLLLSDGLAANQAREFVYMVFLNQAPVFLLGCYLHFLVAEDEAPTTYEMVGLLVWFVSCAAWGYARNEAHLSFPSVYIAIGCFVYLCIKCNFRMGLIESLGRASYAIYLTHFLVIIVLAKLLPTNKGFRTLLVAILLVTVLSYALSKLIDKLLERRIQALVRRLTETNRSGVRLGHS
jgi:exopolysaccharide production protein ExoZ